MDLDIGKIEDKLKKYWEDENIYHFSMNPLGREKNFSIDTPPPQFLQYHTGNGTP